MKENMRVIKWCLLAVLFLATVFIWYVVYIENRHGILTVAFLDVGQGDAIFIEAPNGNQILVDGGPDKKILKSLGLVMPFYDRSIDILGLSHPHLDHFGGLIYLIDRYQIGGVVSSGTVNDTSEFALLQEKLNLSDIKKLVLQRGMRIDMGSGAILEVLSPDRNASDLTPHDGMLVMKLVYGSTSVLLTGDMEENIENYLVSLGGEDLRSQVLKIGHHGSRTSTSQNFLGYVSPEYAVISSGVGNRYGHPHKETLDILDRFGVKTIRTDTSGMVILKSDGEQLTIK